MESYIQELIDPGIARERRRRKRAARPSGLMSPETENNVIGSLRDKSIGTLSAAGNVLDLPGSMVRDTLAGRNPFDQVLSPTSSENRTTGRALAREYGMARRRDTWGNAIGGFGAEVALDPLTYLTFGGSALGKAGQAAKNAGLMDDAAKVAARKAGTAIGSVGTREARVSTTLRDFSNASGESSKVANDLIRRGADPNEALGGLVGIGLPFRDPSFVLGTGERSQRAARALDSAGKAVRFAKVPGTDLQPINAATRLFDVTLNETRTPFGQAIAKQHARSKQAVDAKARGELAEMASQLDDAGATDWASNTAMRESLEGVLPMDFLQGKEREVAERLKANVDQMPQLAEQWGVKLDPFADSEVSYFPRRVTENRRRPGGRGKPTNRIEPRDVDMSRKGFLADLPGGTSQLSAIAQDERLEMLIERGSNISTIAEYIQRAYPQVPALYRARGGDAASDLLEGRHEELAEWFASLSPATRKSGVFGNAPLMDYHARRSSFDQAIQGARTIRDAIVEPGILAPAGTLPAGKGVTVKDFAEKAGLVVGDEQTGFLARLREAMPDADDLASMEIRQEHADDLRSFMKAVSGPEPVNEMVAVLDDVTNLSKAMWTGVWPAFHVRNLLSGQVHNLTLGMFDPSSVKDAHTILKGRVIKEAARIPAVQAEWTRRAGQAAKLTDEEATKILGELAFKHEVLGKFESNATALAGETAPIGGQVTDVTAELLRPGSSKVSAGSIGRKATGRAEGTNFNPLDVRGVGDREASGFGPAAAGEEIGHYVEGLNRIAPFLHLLRKGVDPAEAAKRVGAAQVLYSNKYFSPFERQVMRRIAPFYSFTSRTAKRIAQELMERPGGRLSQTIRASTSAGNDDLAPDHVRDTAPIPISGNPVLEAMIGNAPTGTDRYITGFGLMHEDPLSFGLDPQTAGMEALSRMNPILKGPLEMLTGRSFHQRGADGSGRRLEDMDPGVGRLVANVVGSDQPVQLPLWMEQLAANSPASVAISRARQLTDTRKRLGETPLPGPASLINFLTGVRVTDVSPEQKQRTLEGLIDNRLQGLGGRVFERRFIPEGTPLTANQQAELEQLRALQSKLRRLRRESQ
ncbi:hypothetical protein Pla100_34090 [Neorhodopirellula pilleata]|uniref:Large polyvalent protein associated domain-containing protein n=2 Tax=Neorhodopirellula pilleata TaxID=2714738 RepID=A0A5C6A8P3_9BACT|nr:hypothetical protein Pla100_34090 [Neorhodopirellula pilleata]